MISPAQIKNSLLNMLNPILAPIRQDSQGKGCKAHWLVQALPIIAVLIYGRAI